MGTFPPHPSMYARKAAACRRPRTASLARTLAAACVACVAFTTAQAAPVVFTTSAYSTLAQASVDTVQDGPNLALSAVDPLPLSSNASVPGSGDGEAAATATADAGVLAAGSSATANTAPAQALGVATFFGDFVAPGGPLVLSLALDSTSDAGGAGLATLIVTLFIDGAPVSEQVIDVAGLFTTAFTAAAGSLGALELTLNSETLAAAGTRGANTASLRFGIAEETTAVPSPDMLALWLLGLAATFGPGSVRRRRRTH